jgi:hypothetical protein
MQNGLLTPQATPAPSPTPVTAIEVPAPGPTRPITEAEIGAVRRQRSEMSNQLSSARDRQEELINQIRTAPDGTEQGLIEHLRVVDARVVNIEGDLERTGQWLRSGQVPVGTTLLPPRTFDVPPEAIAARGALLGGLVLVPIMIGFMIMRWRRRGHRRDRMGAQDTQHDARMERLEQAVDAIAIEVERVGESQRYQAKMLAEANLMPAIGDSQRAGEPARMKEYGTGR